MRGQVLIIARSNDVQRHGSNIPRSDPGRIAIQRRSRGLFRLLGRCRPVKQHVFRRSICCVRRGLGQYCAQHVPGLQWHSTANADLARLGRYDIGSSELSRRKSSSGPTSSVPARPRHRRSNSPQADYQTNNFGPDVEGIYATGVGHSVPSNLTVNEKWFGL